MDVTYFAALLRSLSQTPSRRAVLAGLHGGLFALLAGALAGEAAGAKNNKRRKTRKAKRRKKRKNQNQYQASLPPPLPALGAKPDATCPGPDDGDSSNPNDNGRLAESFTALASGALVSAQLLLRKDTEEESDWILRLSPVDGSGLPTNDVLAETSVADTNIPDGISTVTFTFATPFSVVAGDSYALVLTRLDGDRFSWRANHSNPCSGQAFVSTSQTGQFFNLIGDFVLTAFVTS